MFILDTYCLNDFDVGILVDFQPSWYIVVLAKKMKGIMIKIKQRIIEKRNDKYVILKYMPLGL